MSSLNTGLRVGTAKHLDEKYGGIGTDIYPDIATAKAALASYERAQGLTVAIDDGAGNAVEYWFEAGTDDVDLVEKGGGGGLWLDDVASPDIYYSAGAVSIGTDDPLTYDFYVLGNSYFEGDVGISGSLTTEGDVFFLDETGAEQRMMFDVGSTGNSPQIRLYDAAEIERARFNTVGINFDDATLTRKIDLRTSGDSFFDTGFGLAVGTDDPLTYDFYVLGESFFEGNVDVDGGIVADFFNSESTNTQHSFIYRNDANTAFYAQNLSGGEIAAFGHGSSVAGGGTKVFRINSTDITSIVDYYTTQDYTLNTGTFATDNAGELDLADAYTQTNLNSALDVSGAVDLLSTLDVTLAATLDSTLTVAGLSTFNGDVDINDQLYVSDTLTQLELNNPSTSFTTISFLNASVQKAAIWWDNANSEFTLNVNTLGDVLKFSATKGLFNNDVEIVGDLELDTTFTMTTGIALYDDGDLNIGEDYTDIWVSNSGVLYFEGTTIESSGDINLDATKIFSISNKQVNIKRETEADAATVTVDCEDAEEVIIDLTINRAAMTITLQNIGDTVHINYVKDFATDTTLTLTSTDYDFHDQQNSGLVATTITITRNNTTEKYGQISFVRTGFTETGDEVVNFNAQV